jgi:hypothetical protein
MARLSEYNYDDCEDICEEVANGRNIIDVLDSNNDFPSWSTFRRWKNEHQELQTLYVKAIQDKSEAVIFEIDEICQELRSGKLEASVANVLIQTLKWKAAKFYPKMFGDNKNVDMTTKGQSVNQDTKIVFVDKDKEND